jgi:hypothetical protein
MPKSEGAKLRPIAMASLEFFAFNVQAGRHVGSHHAKGLLRRSNIDRLPVAVQHQHNRLVQYVVHKIFAHDHCASCIKVFVFIEMELAAAAGKAPALPVSETGMQTSMLGGKNGSPCW